jgi:hypothetical protein
MPATNHQQEDQARYQDMHLTVWQWSTVAGFGILISTTITALLGAVSWLLVG